MIYLEKFVLPNAEKEDKIIQIKCAENGGALGYVDNIYPCYLFSDKNFFELDCERITILYGGNGSGKSTLLNVIASKLNLDRIAPFNSSELYNYYVELCRFKLGEDDEGYPYRIPEKSRIITSDDIFDYMLTMRSNNDEIAAKKETAFDKYAQLKFGENIRMQGIDDYEALRLQVQSRRKTLSRRKFIRNEVGLETKLNSNGETALNYFQKKLEDNTLYCLDEPENSLSPKLQLELVNLIEDMAHYFGCQFIISTHSPFLLALQSAKIYDLDSSPVTIKNWWELENTKTYFNFFNKHKDKFK